MLYISFIVICSFLFLLTVFIVAYFNVLLKYIKLSENNTIATGLKLELNRTITEKELLIRELHHRVKNNLQIVVSLLNIQARICKNSQIDLFIDKCEKRIKSMLLIHEMLCFSSNVSSVNFKKYIQKLIHNIYKTYDASHINYKIEMDVVEFTIEIAIPLGLITNEIINNSYKYGFPEKKSGEVTVNLIVLEDNLYQLIISDNGIGFDISSKKLGSIGLDIVQLLVNQMSGEFQIQSNNGVECIIFFKIN